MLLPECEKHEFTWFFCQWWNIPKMWDILATHLRTFLWNLLMFYTLKIYGMQEASWWSEGSNPQQYQSLCSVKALQVDEEDEEEEDEEEEKAPADEDLLNLGGTPTQYNSYGLCLGMFSIHCRTSNGKNIKVASTDQANPLAWNRSSNWHEETCEQVIRNQIEHFIWKYLKQVSDPSRRLEFSTAVFGSRKKNKRGGFQEDEIKAIEAEMKEMKEDLPVGYVIWRRTKTKPLAVVGIFREKDGEIWHMEIVPFLSLTPEKQSILNTQFESLPYVTPVFVDLPKTWTNLCFFFLGIHHFTLICNPKNHLNPPFWWTQPLGDPFFVSDGPPSTSAPSAVEKGAHRMRH